MKLTDAGLDAPYVETARILRREYVRVRRSSGYLNLRADQFDGVDIAVQNTLLTQMAALDSAEITDSGSQFHHRCLKAVDVPEGVSQEIIKALPPGYGRGCMYQITARCRHRFSKLLP
jgi:hypothetical protein